MNVIINLQPLLTPLTGIGHYTRELTLELLKYQDSASPIKLRLEGLTGTRLDLLKPDYPLLAGPAESEVEAPRVQPQHERSKFWQFARRYLRNPVTRKVHRCLYSQRLQKRMQRSQEGGTEAIYWEPSYILLPWQGASVVTVHDLSHKRHPEFHPRERVAFFNRHLQESLTRASRINVVSQFTAHELQSLHDIDPVRIDIVPPGVSPRFFAAADTLPPPDLVEHYRLPPRFLLSVGTLEPRKNLARTMQAFASLPLTDQQEAPLLLVGMQGWGSQKVGRDVRRAMQAGTIRHLGYVPDDVLPALYAAASGFVYVSQYEGFGMPVIEAMAAATPVLTANVTATAEVAGQAALLADPLDIDAIRDGLEALLNEDSAQRIQSGRMRAQQFTWNRSADALLASFRTALSQ